ncbi:MAG: hypothetical protein H0S80_10665 [Desulfovibrionaceae bacterium]|nr:hypothetical protein [Desulfovibrionaceae bacterium]
MKPVPILIGWRSGEDESCIEGAITVAIQHVGSLTDEMLGGLEAHVVAFLLAEKSTSKLPVGLSATREQLAVLEKTAEAFHEALKAAEGNPTLMGALRRYGIKQSLAAQVDELPFVARQLAKQLPRGSRWSKEYSPRRDLVRGLAMVFEEATGFAARGEVKHEREGDQYYGRFFELVVDVLKELGHEAPTGKTVLKDIE